MFAFDTTNFDINRNKTNNTLGYVFFVRIHYLFICILCNYIKWFLIILF